MCNALTQVLTWACKCDVAKLNPAVETCLLCKETTINQITVSGCRKFIISMPCQEALSREADRGPNDAALPAAPPLERGFNEAARTHLSCSCRGHGAAHGTARSVWGGLHVDSGAGKKGKAEASFRHPSVCHPTLATDYWLLDAWPKASLAVSLGCQSRAL